MSKNEPLTSSLLAYLSLRFFTVLSFFTVFTIPRNNGIVLTLGSKSINCTQMPDFSLIPIYSAVSFVDVINENNTTKPWVVYAKDPSGVTDVLVVKRFTARDMSQLNYVGKEVLALPIAECFELSCLKPLLVDLTDDFLETVPDNLKVNLSSYGAGLKFATKLQRGYNEFSGALPESYFEEYDIETIFAFDALIRNTDRRLAKPNILLARKDYLLIDHERSLDIQHPFAFYQEVGKYSFLRQLKHVFFEFLYKKNQDTPVQFDTFKEYLRNLDEGCLDAYIRELESAGFNMEDGLLIREYLCEAKRNCENFTNLLKELLT